MYINDTISLQMKTIAIGSFLDFKSTYRFVLHQLVCIVSPRCTEKYIFIPCTNIAFHFNLCTSETCPVALSNGLYVVFDGSTIPVDMNKYDDMTFAIVDTISKIRAKTCKFCGALCKVRSKMCVCCDMRLRHASDMLELSRNRQCCICLERMRKPMCFDCADHVGCARCVRKYNVSNESRFICPYRCPETKTCTSYIHVLKTQSILEEHRQLHTDECRNAQHEFQLAIDGLDSEDEIVAVVENNVQEE